MLPVLNIQLKISFFFFDPVVVATLVYFRRTPQEFSATPLTWDAYVLHYLIEKFIDYKCINK